MTIGFDLELPDVLAFTKHYVKTNKRFRRVKTIGFIVGPLIFFIMLLPKLEPGTDIFVGALVGWVLCSLFYALILILAFRRMPARMAKQVSSNPENANLIGFREMTFSDDEIKVKSDKIDLKMNWDVMVKLGDTDTHYLLYTGENQAYIIPKQKISEQDVKTLDSLFKAHNLY